MPDKISPNVVLDALQSAGVDFAAGVPCSILTGLTNLFHENNAIEHVGATHEGEALAIASGAWLSGRNPVVYLQNSGLGNLVNPLTSLTNLFRVPCLLIVTWRGMPDRNDEPQHQKMGEVTLPMLELLELDYAICPVETDALCATVARLVASAHRNRRPSVLVVPAGSIHSSTARCVVPKVRPVAARPIRLANSAPRPTRRAAMHSVVESCTDSTAFVATTGKTGRELFDLGDSEQNFYMVGAMGHASALALGIAKKTERRVVIFDGDGAALMKLGNLATIGAIGGSNLLHFVLDNGVHDSTGGQPTVSSMVDFAEVALACGYSQAFECDSIETLMACLSSIGPNAGPALVHMHIAPGSTQNLGRPTLAPDQVGDRFRRFLAKPVCSAVSSLQQAEPENRQAPQPQPAQALTEPL